MINFTSENAKKNQISKSISFAFFQKNYTIIFIKKLKQQCKGCNKIWIDFNISSDIIQLDFLTKSKA